MRKTWIIIQSAIIIVFFLKNFSYALEPHIQIVSINSSGNVPVGPAGISTSYAGDISADGRYVVFNSDAYDLVADDTNGVSDVFVRDRVAGTTERVSIATDGSQGNGSSYSATISNDGRYVAFVSVATNLVVAETNPHTTHIFVRDRIAGATKLISISRAGREANGNSESPMISGNGRYVAFQSYAYNLIGHDDTNYKDDIYVRDLVTETTKRVSIATDGSEGNADCYSPSISYDGRYVVFQTRATNLVDRDTNERTDIFVRDMVNGTTKRVSVTTEGWQSNDDSVFPNISDDGRYVSFASSASNLIEGDTNLQTDIFVRDLVAETTKRVSVANDGGEANGTSLVSSISSAGRYVAFSSDATNLVPGDTNLTGDIFVRDIEAGTTKRINVSKYGEQTDFYSILGAISSHGCCVAFTSMATNLIANDTNDGLDVFVYYETPSFAQPPPTGIFLLLQNENL